MQVGLYSTVHLSDNKNGCCRGGCIHRLNCRLNTHLGLSNLAVIERCPTNVMTIVHRLHCTPITVLVLLCVCGVCVFCCMC